MCVSSRFSSSIVPCIGFSVVREDPDAANSGNFPFSNCYFYQATDWISSTKFTTAHIAPFNYYWPKNHQSYLFITILMNQKALDLKRC